MSLVKIDTPEIWPSSNERGTSIYTGTGFLVTILIFEGERLKRRLEADRTRLVIGVLVENVARGPNGDCEGRFKWWEMTRCVGKGGMGGLFSGEQVVSLVSKVSVDEGEG